MVRRWAGLDRNSGERRRFGFRRHYAIAPWRDCSGVCRMELHWGNRCQMYVTPVSAQEVCVVLMSRDQHLRIDDALPQFPDLAARLAGVTPSSEERGAIASSCRYRTVTRGNVALIGDASGRVDAITGDGMCLAFCQANALSAALVAGNLLSYEREHRRLERLPAFMGAFMLMMERPWPLQHRALRAFASRPALFQQLLAMHVRELTWRDFAGVTLSLGWRMACA